jgi:single-strand DNA-binding protein
MLNRIVLVGRLTADPELRYSQEGKPRANFTLAVDRNYKDANGNKQTDFIRIAVFGKQAETIANNLQKGRLVAVEGALRIDNYEKDGVKRQSANVAADSVRFLDWPKEGQQRGGQGNGGFDAPPDDDLPF